MLQFSMQVMRTKNMSSLCTDNVLVTTVNIDFFSYVKFCIKIAQSWGFNKNYLYLKRWIWKSLVKIYLLQKCFHNDKFSCMSNNPIGFKNEKMDK